MMKENVTNADRWERDKARFVASDGSLPADSSFRLGPLALQFAQLTYCLLDASTIGEVLEQVTAAAGGLLPWVDIASVTLRDKDGAFGTPVSTDPVGARLDELQQLYREGPCWEAARESGSAIISSADLSRDSRWPKFGPKADSYGVKSVIAVTLIPGEGVVNPPGALNLFSRHRDGICEDDQYVALLLATYASLALARTDAVAMAELGQINLHRALETRGVIGQAQGILMSRQQISGEEAFDILRRTSQQLNTKLVSIAETLVDRHLEL